MGLGGGRHVLRILIETEGESLGVKEEDDSREDGEGRQAGRPPEAVPDG